MFDAFLLTGQGGYGYLKDWVWWAGMILSEYLVSFVTQKYVFLESFYDWNDLRRFHANTGKYPVDNNRRV